MEIMWRPAEKVKYMLPPPDTSAPPRQDALILIAEDESEIAEILAAYLQRGGLRSVHARDCLLYTSDAADE